MATQDLLYRLAWIGCQDIVGDLPDQDVVVTVLGFDQGQRDQAYTAGDA